MEKPINHLPLTTQDKEELKSKKEVMIDIFKIAGPQVISFICGMGMGLINTAFIGHIGTEA